jgi:hypothetical protein
VPRRNVRDLTESRPLKRGALELEHGEVAGPHEMRTYAGALTTQYAQLRLRAVSCCSRRNRLGEEETMWRLRGPYRSLALLAGPGLFWIVSALQTLVIGRYVADDGWHTYFAWPFALALGYTPLLGALAAVAVAMKSFSSPLLNALLLFFAPYWSFALLTAAPIKFGPPARRALRLLRAPRLRRSSG